RRALARPGAPAGSRGPAGRLAAGPLPPREPLAVLFRPRGSPPPARGPPWLLPLGRGPPSGAQASGGKSGRHLYAPPRRYRPRLRLAASEGVAARLVLPGRGAETARARPLDPPCGESLGGGEEQALGRVPDGRTARAGHPGRAARGAVRGARG